MVVHRQLYSFFRRTVSHCWVLLDSVFRLTDVAFWFSWSLGIWMDSIPFIFLLETGVSWGVTLVNITKIGVKFRLYTFPHKTADVLQSRNFAFISDVCCNIFPLFNEMVRQAFHYLPEVVIGIDVRKVIILAKSCKAIDDIEGKLTKRLPLIRLNFFLSVILRMNALAMTLVCPKCSFNVFNAVAYMIPCEPRPDIVCSASPVTCILNCTILVSSVKCGLS